jgi:hypothetical protein
MSMDKFRDFMANQEIYFRRDDLLKKGDPSEGLPTDDYVRNAGGLSKLDLRDEMDLNNTQAFVRQNSEGYYINCWSLNNEESRLRMWFSYAQEGVAVCSRYSLLKSTLEKLIDNVHLGKVRYGNKEMTGFNTLQFIFTKREDFAWENEVRAVLCSYNPLGGQNRHFDEQNFPHREPLDGLNPLPKWVHDHKRRRVELGSLLTGIKASPWADDSTLAEARCWVKALNVDLTVSFDLKSDFTPTRDELRRQGWSGKPRSIGV